MVQHVKPIRFALVEERDGWGRGPWRSGLKAACLESRRSRFRTPLWFLKRNVSSPLVRKDSILWGLSDRVVACSASDHQDSDFAWRAVSSHSSHNPQEILLAQFSLLYAQRCPKIPFIHKGWLVEDTININYYFCVSCNIFMIFGTFAEVHVFN